MQVLLEKQKNTSDSLRIWAARNSILIYIDGICGNIPFGRLTYCGENETTISYHGFTDLVIKVDCLLNQNGGVGAENQIRSVPHTKRTKEQNYNPITCCKQAEDNCKKAKAFMHIQILYRQHASWQGQLYSPYLEQNRIPFRSVFELLHLMTGLLDIVQA